MQYLPFGTSFIRWRIFNECPMAMLLVPMMTGILLAETDMLPNGSAPYLLCISALLLAGAAVAGLSRRKRRTTFLNYSFASLAALALMGIGAASDLLERTRFKVDWPDNEALWQGVVADSPRTTEKTYRLTLRLKDTSHKIQLSVLKTALDTMPQVGDALQFNATIKPPYNLKDSDFDYARWLQRQHFAGQAFVAKSITVLPNAEANKITQSLSYIDHLSIKALQLRHTMLQKYTSLNLDADETAIMAALTLGDKSMVSQTTRSVFSQTGASHVLALSGLHLGILVSLLMFLLRPLRLRKWGHCLIALICVSVAGSFVILTGCSVSILRAALMLSLALLLGLRGEGFSSLNNVVLAALLILLFSPQSLMDTGFQLSFMSVWCILFFLPYYRLSSWREGVWVKRWALDFLYITLVAQLATAPIVAATFGRLPLLFILTNLLVIPCAYVLLIGGLLYVLFSWCGPIASCLGWVVSHGVSLMLRSLEWIASLPFASVQVHLSAPTCCCIYALIFSLAGLCLTKRRCYLYAAILSLGLAITMQVHLA